MIRTLTPSKSLMLKNLTIARSLSPSKLILLLGSTLTVMAGATIAPSLPQIKANFSEVDNIDLLSRLILTAPALFIAIGAPLAGNLTDKFGRLPMLFGGIVLYALSGTAPLLLNDVYAIIASRGLLGVSVAAIMTSLTTLIGDYYQGEERNQTLGLQGAFMAFGGFMFLTAGGLLADVNWRFPFLIYALAIFLLPFAYKNLEEPKSIQSGRSSDSFRLKGRLLWLVGFTYLLVCLDFVLFYMLPVHLPFYLKELDIESNTLSGLALAALTLSGGLSSLGYRKLKRRMSYTGIYALLFSLCAGGMFILAFANSFWLVLTAQIVSGFGFGLFMPNANLFLVNETPPRVRGRVISGVTTAVFLGQFISPLVTNPLKDSVGLAESFQAAAFSLAGVSLVFLIILWRQRLNASEV